LVGLTRGVNFTNILQTAFSPKKIQTQTLRREKLNETHSYGKGAQRWQFHQHFISIFYPDFLVYTVERKSRAEFMSSSVP